jgi:BCD family chlorophyll transporter-like MFS transporter
MRFTRLLRLGLRQFAAGMLSVLTVGILNRVMKVEMGLALGLVSVIVGAHYFAAPLAIPLGHRSDRLPILGRHRVPYILGGTLLTMAATAAAPFVALFLSGDPGSSLGVALGILTFLVLGVGMYSAGTAYLSLISDLTPEDEQGKAVAIVWSMMMLGILAGVFLGIGILDDYSPEGLVRLFFLMSGLVGGLTLVAVWGQEPAAPPRPSREAVGGRQAWALLTTGRQTRLFFAFLFMGILFLFLQQVVLEPWGGDVLGLAVRQTTLFNAYQMVGALVGMAAAGAWLSPRLGNKATAAMGLGIASLSFAWLAAASLTAQAAWANPAILLMGLGMGLFNVGGLALMMGMTSAGQTGMFMGAWTLAQAMANGLASVGGGIVHDIGLAASGSEGTAYASVFAIEALGLAATWAILSRLSLTEFRQHVLRVTAPSESG